VRIGPPPLKYLSSRLRSLRPAPNQSATNHRGGRHLRDQLHRFPNTRTQVSAVPIVVTFASLAGTGQPATAAGMRAEIVGLQLQLQSPTPADGGTQINCAGVNRAPDNVQLVPN